MNTETRTAPTILVIEDNALIRKLVRVTLQNSGYSLIEAADGASAIELLAHGDPTPVLILQDLILPDINGFDLVRRLRSLPGGANVPILAFSGFLGRLDEAQMLAAGFNGLLVKPIEPSQLIREIEPYLSPEPATVRSRRGPRILVVDDDPIQCRLTRVALSGLGFGVTTAGSGAEGVEAAIRERPDAVLSDVLMADMDGFEFCAKIRSDQRSHRTPVVLITNHHVEQEDFALALRMGAQDLLVRTPDLTDAAERLRVAVHTVPPPAPELEDFSELQRAYLKRITTHLGRQIKANAGLSQRISLMAASMSVLGTVSRMLGPTADAERALEEVLAQCVDAAGLSRAALFLRPETGSDWRCTAQVGFGAAEGMDLDTLFLHQDLLEETLERADALMLSGADRDGAVQTLLARCGASSAILTRVDPEPGRRGVLLLLSSVSAINGKEWRGFAQTIAGQFGQALALGGAFRMLARSEQQHRLLIDSVHEYSIILLEPTGEVATWNRGAERLHGYAAKEIIGSHFSTFHSEEDRSRGQPAELLRQAANGARARAEGWQVRSDGSRFWAEILIAPVRAADGQLTGFAEVTRDFTDRRRAEELFQRTVEAAPNGMLMIDENGGIVLANSRLSQMFCYDEGALTGKSVGSLLPNLFREGDISYRESFETMPSARPNGKGRDLAAARSDGSEFPVEVGLNPVELDGRPFIIASVVDITERKTAELVLASREARVRALMENANDGIAVLSAEGFVLEANRRWSELLGLPVEEIVGRHISELVAGGEEVVRFEESVRTGAERVQGVRVRRPDGSVRVIDSSQSIIRIGEQTVVLMIARDVTRQQALEEKLLQSQKLEAIGRLAGGIAHDFNNLLTAIQGNAVFIRDRLGHGNDLIADIDEVLHAAERAAGLTRQLLVFSRQQVLAPRVIDLVDLVRSTEKMLSRLIGEDIDVVTFLHPDTGRVFADPGQIEQVVMNLVVNARDAMPAGGRLTIETANMDLDDDYADQHAAGKTGAYVRLAVSDTGMGMSREVQANIFEPFFTTKEAGKGTGLGLATVYGIVTQSGGFVWVYSEPGRGTAFKIYLPRVDKALEALATTPKVGLSVGKETILVAEDDPMVRRMLVRSLEILGYTVLSAATPTEVLAIARNLGDPPDLLVTDVVMPGMSGRELAEQLTDLWPRLRVLFSSGYTDDAIVRNGLAAGGIDFLQKPYTPDAAARIVRTVLDR